MESKQHTDNATQKANSSVQNRSNSLQVATILAKRGWCVIPISRGEKSPKLTNWQKLRLSANELPAHFSQECNIGILCGEPSNWLIDIDLDAPEAVNAAPYFLPKTDFRHGRETNPESHWWYYSPRLSTKQFVDPDCKDKGEATLVEIRSTGGQTVAPSSLHPSGEQYKASAKGEPAMVDADKLFRSVSRLAAASLLARHWSDGSRHNASLALAGTLIRHGWTEEQTEYFIEAVTVAAKDEEWQSRCRNVMDTASRVDADQPVRGIPTLVEIFGENVIGKVTDWLGINRKQSSTMLTGSTIAGSAVSSEALTLIQTNDRQLRDVVDDTLNSMIAKNDPPVVYVRSGQLVRVKVDEHGCGLIDLYGKVALRTHANRCADFVTITVRQNKGEEIILRREIHPPLEVMEDILARGDFPTTLPALTGIVASPIVSKVGVLEITPGYLPSAQLYFQAPEGTLSLTSIPPTPAAINQALSLLFDELLNGFPFADQSSKAHTLVAILEPFVRPYINAPTPLKLIDAPTRATGKSLLAETIAAIFSPLGVMPTTAPRDEEEWRKKITAALLSGSSFIWIDNIEGKLSSESLCIALTSMTWSDRLLGTNTEAKLPVNCQWLATSNNAVLHDDLVTRSILIRLDARVENPEERRGFKVADPPGFVRENRCQVLNAVLLLIRAWLEAGCPEYQGEAVNRFGRWTKVMGGILECLGVPGFLENNSQLAQGASPEREAWKEFVKAWENEFGSNKVLAKHLMDIAFGEFNNGERDSSQGLLTEYIPGTDDHKLQTKLGIALGKRREQVFSGYRIQKVTGGRHTEYYLEQVSPESSEAASHHENISPNGRHCSVPQKAESDKAENEQAENEHKACTPASFADLTPAISTGESSPLDFHNLIPHGLEQRVQPLKGCNDKRETRHTLEALSNSFILSDTQQIDIGNGQLVEIRPPFDGDWDHADVVRFTTDDGKWHDFRKDWSYTNGEEDSDPRKIFSWGYS